MPKLHGVRSSAHVAVLFVLAAWSVAACSNVPSDPGFAGHPMDCAVGFPHADCAPGSLGYQKALALKEAATARDASDDARCRSFGLQFGTQGYAQCRMNIDNQRAANTRAVLNAQQPMPPRPSLPATTNCMTSDSNIGGIVSGTTNCTTQ